MKIKEACPLCSRDVSGNKKAGYLCKSCRVKFKDKDLIMKRGLFLGRFQPFHNGHLEVIKLALEEVDELYIIIGSSQESYTVLNPFTADEREKMMDVTLKDMDFKNYKFVQIPDIRNDNEYVTHVEKFIPKIDVVYAAENPLTAELFSKAGYKVMLTERFFDISSTTIREAILKNQEWKELVPRRILAELRKINGLERIKSIK